MPDAVLDSPVESPPPAPLPVHEPPPDPRSKLHELAERLARCQDRRLFIEFLRLRRSLR